MTNDQVAHLVNDIIQTWPSGARARIWTEALRHLEHDAARAAYLRLRDSDAQRAPNVGELLAIYRRIQERERAQSVTQPALPTDEPRVPGNVGWAIANAAYRQHYGRDLGAPVDPDPERMVELIERHGTRVKDGYAWHYRELGDELRDDHKLAHASLPAIGLRLHWASNGALILHDGDGPQP